MHSKKMDARKPLLETRDSGVSFTPSPPPKKSSLPRPSEGGAKSMHKELHHRRPSWDNFNQHVCSNPEEFHEEMIIPPRLDLSSIIGNDSESDISSAGMVSTDRTSQSNDDQHPELAIDTPSTDSRTSPVGRVQQGYQSDIESTSPSPAPSSSSSPSSLGCCNLRRCGSGELEDESEGSVLKVKLKLKSARPRSSSGVRKKGLFATNVRDSPPLASSTTLIGNQKATNHDTEDVMRSKYAPLPGIGVQGANPNANISREHREMEQKQSANDQGLKSSTVGNTQDIRDQRLRALERSASQGEISRKFPTPPPQSAKTVSRRAMRMQQFARRKSASQAESASRQSRRPSSQASDSCNNVLLAIRLPNGSRVQNLFDISQSLQSIVQFALKGGECSLDISSVCVVTNDMPKRELRDLSQTIETAGLGDRTLLNLEEID